MCSSVPITDDPYAAGAALARGALVGLPTETVYGLGVDATNEDAVRRLFTVKRRPTASPLIVHLSGADELDAWARDVPHWARALVRAWWPGPLTVVLAGTGRATASVTAGRSTVALRVPGPRIARDAIAASGTGIAAPSANLHGQVSPTRATHVAHAFAAREVSLVLDGGRCRVGIESTIVDCTGPQPRLLRPGAVTAAQISACTGLGVQLGVTRVAVADLANVPVPAPGQARHHYAPAARVHAVDQLEAALDRARLCHRRGGRAGLVICGWDEADISDTGAMVQVLLATREPDAFARGLYAALHEADDQGLTDVVVVLPVDEELAPALHDRVSRAAAPRT